MPASGSDGCDKSTTYRGPVLRYYHVSTVWRTWWASQRSGHHSGRRCRPPPCAASPSWGTRQSSTSLEQAGHVDRWSPVSLHNESVHSIHKAFRVITGPPTHGVGGQYCFAIWSLSSLSVVVCNTTRWGCRRLHPHRPSDEVMPPPV